MYNMDTDTYVCDYCGIEIKWDDADDVCGDMFECEHCGTHFCTKCFVDHLGNAKYTDMLQNSDKVLCHDCYAKRNIIDLDTLKTPQDYIEAFNKLNNHSEWPITLYPHSSCRLELYYHEDYPERILVDKYFSSHVYRCPKCKGKLMPSPLANSYNGYTYACENCDEDFFACEVDETDIGNECNGTVKDATFTSVWDGGTEITTKCKVNMQTREVFSIEQMNDEFDVDILDYEYITVDGIKHVVYQREDLVNKCNDIQNNSFWY